MKVNKFNSNLIFPEEAADFFPVIDIVDNLIALLCLCSLDVSSSLDTRPAIEVSYRPAVEDNTQVRAFVFLQSYRIYTLSMGFGLTPPLNPTTVRLSVLRKVKPQFNYL